MMEHLEEMIIDIEQRLLRERKEEGIKIGKEEGIKIGKEKERIEIAKTMLKDNYSKKEILKISKINENQFNQIQKTLKNN